jgi:hypothetical protein
MSEFICPLTNVACVYGNYCREVKGESELTLDDYNIDMLHSFTKALAAVPLDLLQSGMSSFCSEERIIKVGDAAGLDAYVEALDDNAIKRMKWGEGMIIAIHKERTRRS